MPTLRFKGHVVESKTGESVLDTLDRAGLGVGSSCRAGVCQACMLCCVEGVPDPKAQIGLRPALRSKGYFLACQCAADQDMTLQEGELTPSFLPAVLVNRSQLSSRVHRLHFQLTAPIDHHAGQFISIRRADHLLRSYSIASVPNEKNTIELHVENIPNGKISPWLCNELSVGDSVELRGPYGESYYLADNVQIPLLLVAGGTGLAPIFGVLNDALASGHIGPIHLFHGSEFAEGIYFHKELDKLVSENANLQYTPCTWNQSTDWTQSGHVGDVALRMHPNISGYRVYLSGSPEMVRITKKMAFIKGAKMNDIYSDPFEFSQ